MRRRIAAIATFSLVSLFAACGDDAPPPISPQQPPPLAAKPSAPEALSSDVELAALAARVLRSESTPADKELLQREDGDAVAMVIARAATSDPATQGKVMQDLTALGAPALPGLRRGLQSTDPAQRRVAVKVLWDPLESTCRHASLSIL